jgi:hypothetical protein
MSIINKLTEGIVRRDLSKEGAALLTKWEKTGLLEGITDDRTRQGMACLLENQAKELLREASSMSGLGATGTVGDVEGFAAVAFPIVRRVFGGLIANDLVSVQPMSLPSGLIFFLDFTYGGPDNPRLDYTEGDSVYGGGRVASQITGGVLLTGDDAEQGFYALNNGYSSPTASVDVSSVIQLEASGVVGDPSAGDDVDRLCRFDPDLSGTAVAVGSIPLATLTAGQLNVKDYVTITALNGTAVVTEQVRRLTRDADANDQTVGTITSGDLIIVVTGTDVADAASNFGNVNTASFAIDDAFDDATALGAVQGESNWGLEGEANIPEIDIKVDSIAVTAKTKKLKAKWTPELAQDLNAYHNLDAEVELTSILSEHIALELDQEILEDLVKGATAGKLYWSRLPGKFVNRETGAGISGGSFPDFTGNVSEWYETLVETINDVSAAIHRKTLRGGANFIVVSPEVANLLEFTAGFRGSVTHDDDRGQVGAVRVGSLSKKFDVYVDPYFPRNVVLCGRKGSSFLESGYVYAPYVPLQMTPTIFGTEDFVPRKGVMTRYAKKMVRPDMYGLVIVTDLV